jgi:uncharacterized membrane protein YeaQ/YmgE (transglycosylase-associated protein family)
VSLLEIALLLLVAGICGAIAEAIAGYSHLGCLGSVAIGFIGALLGTYLARRLGMPEWFALSIGTVKFPIIWSIIGATIFVALIGLLRRGRD